MSGEACDVKPKVTFPCKYDCGSTALWKVVYHRTVVLIGRKKISDKVCDEHVALACSRSDDTAQVIPLFKIGPGGRRYLEGGQLLGDPTPSQARADERERWTWALEAFGAKLKAEGGSVDLLDRFRKFVAEEWGEQGPKHA